jgi:hypothetical protein
VTMNLVYTIVCYSKRVDEEAVALGHPLGCTGAKLSVQLFNEMRRKKLKCGVAICRTADGWERCIERRVCLSC